MVNLITSTMNDDKNNDKQWRTDNNKRLKQVGKITCSYRSVPPAVIRLICSSDEEAGDGSVPRDAIGSPKELAKRKGWRLMMNNTLGNEVSKQEKMMRLVGILHYHHQRTQQEPATKGSYKNRTRRVIGRALKQLRDFEVTEKGRRRAAVLSRSGIPKETKAMPFGPTLTPGFGRRQEVRCPGTPEEEAVDSIGFISLFPFIIFIFMIFNFYSYIYIKIEYSYSIITYNYIFLI